MTKRYGISMEVVRYDNNGDVWEGIGAICSRYAVTDYSTLQRYIEQYMDAADQLMRRDPTRTERWPEDSPLEQEQVYGYA